LPHRRRKRCARSTHNSCAHLSVPPLGSPDTLADTPRPALHVYSGQDQYSGHVSVRVSRITSQVKLYSGQDQYTRTAIGTLWARAAQRCGATRAVLAAVAPPHPHLSQMPICHHMREQHCSHRPSHARAAADARLASSPEDPPVAAAQRRELVLDQVARHAVVLALSRRAPAVEV
jgi:hypothetical protein